MSGYQIMDYPPVNDKREPPESENDGYADSRKESASESLRQRSAEELAEIVGAKEDRKVRAKDDAYRSIWFGLGMFGVIGWSVTLPAMACVALGVWIDRRWPSPYSWTLMLLFVGVILGCLNAWYWLSQERSKWEK